MWRGVAVRKGERFEAWQGLVVDRAWHAFLYNCEKSSPRMEKVSS